MILGCRKGSIAAWSSLIVLLLLASFAAGGTVYVENAREYVVGEDGSRVGASNGWAVVVYRDGGNGRVDGYGQGDDVVVAVLKKGWSDDGYFMFSFLFEGGARLFCRLLNSSDFVDDAHPGGATRFADFSRGLRPVPILGAIGMYTVDPGGVAQNSWRDIPSVGGKD